MNRARALGLLSLLAACDSTGAAPAAPAAPGLVTDRTAAGSATAVQVDGSDAGPAALRLDDPTGAAHVGRAPRRLDVDQYRASLAGLLGASWTGPRTILAPEEVGGTRYEPEADLLAFFTPTLGKPDWVVTTSEVLEPTVTFTKLTSDAAHSVCRRAVVADVARAPAARLLLVAAAETDTLPANEAAVRRNIAALALRLWGLDVAPDSGTVDGVLGVFRVAVAQPGATPLDGWRAVCIDLATDARFLTY